ncbi:MAG: hypothetical protein J5I93_04500 [Pirellulaceae bacterium]|nr:hypothetical protein [Pirellulaceae bacterium]
MMNWTLTPTRHSDELEPEQAGRLVSLGKACSRPHGPDVRPIGELASVSFRATPVVLAERIMVDRKSNKMLLAAGIFVLLCGILMVVIQLDGWARLGEKLQLGVAVVFLSLGTVLVAVSRHRKRDN